MPGPSSVLISRIEHLGRLLKNLPQSLPLDPPNSSYDFGLDTEMVEEEGVWFAFNRNLEVCFETHKLGRSGTITFRERGRRYEALVGMFKETVKKLAKDSEHDFLREVWLERLINAAQQQGAKDLRQTGVGGTKRPAPEIHISAVDEHPKKCSKASHSPHTDARLSTVNVDSNSEGHESDLELNVQCKHVTIRMIENPRPSTLPVVIDLQKTKQMSFKEETLKAAREQRKKNLATERQRRRRERIKATQPKGKKAQKNVNEVLRAESQTSSLSTMDLAKLSRPDSDWKDQRTGKNEQIAPKVGWSAQTIASRLAQDQPSLFSHLNKGTVQKWLDKETKRGWSPVTIQNVKRRHALAGSGQTGVLAKYPAVMKEITDTLRGLRTSGVPVSVVVARSIMLAVIEKHEPGLLLTEFKCSEKFVWSFFESVLDWSPRKGTRAAAHLPADAEETCEECFFRLVYIMKWYNVPPKLVVNFDQVGCYLLPNSSTTFHECGSKQVDIVAKDEKRAYSLLVASTADGDFLPFQQVWAGASERSLPSHDAHGMNNAIERGFHFAFAKSDKKTSHYSTLKTMREWIENILEPWRKVVIETDPDLDDDQHAIVYLDCYPVHTSQDFRTYVWEKYPCTGKFQPADVGLNRVIKHRLKQNQVNFLVEAHSNQISRRLVPEQVKFTTSLPVLRDASVAALVDVYDFMTSAAGRELVKKGWERCIAKEWNLSGDCLTSKQSCTALNTYLHTHDALRNEIENRMGTVHNDSEELLEHVEEMREDDSNVPLSAVINDALGISIDKAYNLNLGYVVSEVKQAADQTLMAAGDAEDVWAWNNGELWGKKLPTVSADEP
ncbi:uncharacterized protein HD556DRAFT_1304341 [Suillus plorans]|uniref:DDE-1 domain-containing protein n=1 Tax=Suillus plorans TaxID=116603 RepID=A0A9P7J4G3_9AGAM|nr:uncharacterized protein HD556DRAFT_1304341 [Suillus plorans]KAG1802170.1 hypothetical protein HD556DRAFT_1304341 [Suillus plorans]